MTTTPWAVDYGRITPILTKALQEVIAENEELKAYKVQSQDQMATLSARLDLLEKQ